MAIYTEKYGYISYECEDLIAEVNEDIDIFGLSTMAYAVYKHLPKYDVNVITSYMVCERPDDTQATKQSLGRRDVSSQEEREQIRKFKASLQPNEKMITMSLFDLLNALNIQNSLFEDSIEQTK